MKEKEPAPPSFPVTSWTWRGRFILSYSGCVLPKYWFFLLLLFFKRSNVVPFFNYHLCVFQNRYSKRTNLNRCNKEWIKLLYLIFIVGSIIIPRINLLKTGRHLGSFILPETKRAMCTWCAAFTVTNSQQKKITYSLLLLLWWDKDFSSSLHRLLPGLEPSSSFWKLKKRES